MKILALDIATKTGWAMCDNGKHDYGMFVCKSKNRGSRYETFTFELLKLFASFNYSKPDIIVFEKAFQKSQRSAELYHGFLAMLEYRAWQYGIDLMPVYATHLKKWATGNGKASKNDMIEAARLLGWNPKDDNEADALLLLEYAQETIKK